MMRDVIKTYSMLIFVQISHVHEITISVWLFIFIFCGVTRSLSEVYSDQLFALLTWFCQLTRRVEVFRMCQAAVCLDVTFTAMPPLPQGCPVATYSTGSCSEGPSSIHEGITLWTPTSHAE